MNGTRRLHVSVARLALMVPVAAAILVGASVGASGGSQMARQTEPPDATVDQGRELFLGSCSSCHDPDGSGNDLGPSIVDEGAASADFVLRTGRMPLADPDDQAERRPPGFSDDQIVALVAFVASLGDGPAIPDVSPARGNVARGTELFGQNCASCHQTLGQGGAVNSGHRATDLQSATPVQVGQAMLVGPDIMPVFSYFDRQQVDDIAAYVQTIQDSDDRGGLGIGHIGPVAEGYVVWFVGLVPLLLLARWIGTRKGA